MLNFYDESKTKAENDHEAHKARHNRDILQYSTAAVVLATAVATSIITGKKLIDIFR